MVSQVEGLLLMLPLDQPKIFGSDPSLRRRRLLMVLIDEADPQAEATGRWRPCLYGSLTVCWPLQCQQCLHPGTGAQLPTPE